MRIRDKSIIDADRVDLILVDDALSRRWKESGYPLRFFVRENRQELTKLVRQHRRGKYP
jgi:hypothetical protein